MIIYTSDDVAVLILDIMDKVLLNFVVCMQV